MRNAIKQWNVRITKVCVCGYSIDLSVHKIETKHPVWFLYKTENPLYRRMKQPLKWTGMAERPDHPAICGATSPENMMPVGKDRVSSNRIAWKGFSEKGQHVLAGGSYAVVTEAANDLPQDKIKHWSRLKKAAVLVAGVWFIIYQGDFAMLNFLLDKCE